MRYLISLTIFIFFTVSLRSQTYSDALRYSNFRVDGTARSMATGGVMSSFGTDFSVLSTNPAGLGWYRSSEFVFTPSFEGTRAKALLTNDDGARSSDENLNKIMLDNFGFVFTSRPSRSGLRTFNFGLGFNRLADFNQLFTYEGNTKGSIVDRFQEMANSPAGFDEFESGLAYNVEALYDWDDDGFYDSDMELAPNALIKKSQDIRTSGSINELVFAFGGNFEEKLLFGATIGVPFLNYHEDKFYTEEDTGEGEDGDVPLFDKLEYDEYLSTTGVGINFKMGLLYRPVQMFRLGLAVHSPTAFALEDSYSSNMAYQYTLDDGTVENYDESPDGLFDYKLRTPWRVIGSAGVLFNQRGFLSGEIEWVDYTTSNFRYSDFDGNEADVNAAIIDNLQAVLNIKLGGEVVVDKFRFRGGVNLLPSPLEGDNTVSTTYSAGFGIREQNFFIDFGYRYRTLKETYVPYLTSEAPMQFVDKDISKNKFIITIGINM